jgi:hypothetical protein
MSYLADISEWLVSTEGWTKGELSSLFALPARGAGKNVFQQLYMQRPSVDEGIRGTTANTIVVDEAASTITVDILRDAIEHIELRRDRLLWEDFPKFGPIPTAKVDGKWLSRDDVKATFKDEKHPSADTYLVLEKLDRKDPRHPNPAAGTQRLWYVLQGQKRVQVKNLSQGQGRARAMHLAEIKRIEDAKAAAERERLIAATEAYEKAQREHEHLTNLPAFGGF